MVHKLSHDISYVHVTTDIFNLDSLCLLVSLSYTNVFKQVVVTAGYNLKQTHIHACTLTMHTNTHKLFKQKKLSDPVTSASFN